MDFKQLAMSLSNIEHEKTFYVSFDAEILDFTDNEFILNLNINTLESKLSLNFNTDQDLLMFLEIAKLSIFSKENKILTWNWKNFVSYVLGRLNIKLQIDAGLIDLKIIESYVGIKRNAPETLPGALNRLRERVVDGSWQKFQNIYKKIQIPLMTSVIPHLETIGILSNKKIHAYYEINGQENGRLLCYNAFKNGFIPHNLSFENKKELKPLNYDQIFMYFDFKGMEVKVLQWLSGDEKLAELCESEDVYSAIYEEITKQKCEDRIKSKKIFLPVIYGQSSKALAESIKVPLEVAEKLILRIKEIFSKAVNYVLNYQEKLKENGFVEDYFGKKRNFDGKEYRVRNFVVQSPAALICLEKLVLLHYNLKSITDLTYSVHDGYMVYATKENWKEVFKIGYESLTTESEICPGLKLNVSCSAGRNLNNLKIIKKV